MGRPGRLIKWFYYYCIMMLELAGKARVGRHSRRYALYLDDELSRALAGYKGEVRVFVNGIILKLKPTTVPGGVIIYLPKLMNDTWAEYYGQWIRVVIKLD